MRAFNEPDAFLPTDLILRRAAGDLSARELERRADAWRPWRAYAVMLLWQAALDAPARATRRPDVRHSGSSHAHIPSSSLARRRARTGTSPPPASSRAEGASSQPSSTRVVEVRSYNLKPGTRDRFHALFLRDALPMLHRWKVDVIAYGPSLHDTDSYYLMRGFPGVDQRQTSEDAFYGSDEWRNGPRDAILADIISYTTIVIRLDAETIGGLRRLLPAVNATRRHND